MEAILKKSIKEKATNIKIQYGEGYDVVRKIKPPKKDYSHIMPSGDDHGKGAHRLLSTLVYDVLEGNNQHKKIAKTSINKEILSHDFIDKPFVDKLTDIELSNVPLLSQISSEKANFLPTQNSSSKKQLMKINKLLMDNYGLLIKLNLQNCKLNDQNMLLLSNGLLKNRILLSINLLNNHITDNGCKELCHSLLFHPSIHTLWIGNNLISDIGFKHCITLVGRNNNIKDLNVSNLWPHENAWSQTMLSMHPHVTYVGIASYLSLFNIFRLQRINTDRSSRNLLSKSQRSSSSDLLNSNHDRSKSPPINLIDSNPNNRIPLLQRSDSNKSFLRNSFNKLQIQTENEKQSSIHSENNPLINKIISNSHVAPHNNNLTSLNLSNQRLRDTGAAMLFSILKLCKMRAVNLSYNELTSKCCLELRKQLSDSILLEKLDLSHNKINNIGCIDIAHGLISYYPDLERRREDLKLIEKSNSEFVAFKLPSEMEGNGTYLRYLDLSFNEINDEGLDYLFQICVKYFESLSLLSLNTIGNTSSDHRAESLISQKGFNVFNWEEYDESLIFPKATIEKLKRSHSTNSMDSFDSFDELDDQSDDDVNAIGAFQRQITYLNKKHEFKIQNEKLSKSNIIIDNHTDDSNNLNRIKVLPPLDPQLQAKADHITSINAQTHGVAALPAGVGILGKNPFISNYFNIQNNLPNDEINQFIMSPTVSRSNEENNLTSKLISNENSLLTAMSAISLTDNNNGLNNLNAKTSFSVEGNDLIPLRPRSTVSESYGINYLHLNRPMSQHNAVQNIPSVINGMITTNLSTSNVTKNNSILVSPSQEIGMRPIRTLGSFSKPTLVENNGVNSGKITRQNTIKSHLSADSDEDYSRKNSSQNSRNSSPSPLQSPKSKINMSRSNSNIGKLSKSTSRVGQSRGQSRRNAKRFEMGPDTKIVDKRKVHEIGKSLGIPEIKSIGIRPVRNISEFGDSGQHLMYLRVSKPADSTENRPYSYLKIAADRVKFREDLMKKRQTKEYKENKAIALAVRPKHQAHKSAIPHVPNKFWVDWKKKIRIQYNNGIDNAAGCTSTKMDYSPVASHAGSPRAIVVGSSSPPMSPHNATSSSGFDAYMLAGPLAESEGYKRHLSVKNRNNITPGQILAARRKEKYIQMKLKNQNSTN
eukprot:gene12003-16070_t